MYIKLDNKELEFLRLALNEAMDNTKNKARYKMYEQLLDKASKENEIWHIQNMNICSDGTAYDMSLMADHEPTEDELRKAFAEDYGEEEGCEMDEWMTSSEVYKLYAEEI